MKAYGQGQWGEILKAEPYQRVLSGKTRVHLKDKWRNLSVRAEQPKTCTCSIPPLSHLLGGEGWRASAPVSGVSSSVFFPPTICSHEDLLSCGQRPSSHPGFPWQPDAHHAQPVSPPFFLSFSPGGKGL